MPNNLLTMDLKNGHAEYGANHPIILLKTKVSEGLQKYKLGWLTAEPAKICNSANEISLIDCLLSFIVNYSYWESNETESRFVFAALLRTFKEADAISTILLWFKDAHAIHSGRQKENLWQLLVDFSVEQIRRRPLEEDFINQWRDHPHMPEEVENLCKWLEESIWAEREEYRTNMVASDPQTIYVSALQIYFVDEMCEFVTGDCYLQDSCSEEDLDVIKKLVELREFVPAFISWIEFAKSICINGENQWPETVISDFCGSGIVQDIIKRLD